MAVKIFFVSIALSILILAIGITPALALEDNQLLEDYLYQCPPSKKQILPVLKVLPFKVISDTISGVSATTPTIVIPYSPETFQWLGKNLEMAVLPNLRVCILGEKLKRFVLPTELESQFYIMAGIATLFSPCITERSHTKRLRCVHERTAQIDSLYVGQSLFLNRALIGSSSKLITLLEFWGVGHVTLFVVKRELTINLYLKRKIHSAYRLWMFVTAS